MRLLFNQFSSSRYWVLPLIALASLITCGVAIADGPVGPGSLPGGVTVTDSDPGSGEQWGRAGGRTISHSVNDQSNFTSLTWGAVGASAAGLAFDGTIDAAAETMSLNLGASDLANGVAVWTGSATLPLSTGGSLNLPTRFTLTVVDAGGSPVTLSVVPGGNEPGLDVLNANGDFTATLLFEANHNGSFGIPAGWTPVLDLFDDSRLPTIPGDPPGPGATGPVITSFESGYFFGAVQGLSIEEHDDNMFAQTDMIKGQLDFLTTEAVNRLQGLGIKQNDILNAITGGHSNILNAIDVILQSLPDFPEIPSNLATSDDVSSVREDLQSILLTLFGILPCPEEAGDLCESATFISDLAGKAITIQALEVSHSSSGKDRRWLLTTSVDGKLVDVDLEKVLIINVNKDNPAIVEDVTSMAVPMRLSVGLLDVMIPMPKGSEKAKAIKFDVFYENDHAEAYGSALVGSNLQGEKD